MIDSASGSAGYLFDLPRFATSGEKAYKPGLERMNRLMAAMLDPHTRYPTIHVAGSNGKGSTASFLSAIATASGLRAGLHTSPHLRHVGERMRVDGVPAPAAWVDAAAARFEGLFLSTEASFFEATTALSFLYFMEQKVDVAIIEVGLGGRFDATNVVKPELSIITSVSLEHTDILGESIALIAAEKAGIVKPGTPILTAVCGDEALAAIRRSSEQNEARLHLVQEEVRVGFHPPDSGSSSMLATFSTPGGTYADVNLGLAGEHQATNAALALRATQLAPVFADVGPEAVLSGLRDVVRLSGIRGRCERIVERPSIFVDVAHNAEAMILSLDTWIARTSMPTHVFVGVMKDKRIDAFARRVCTHDIPVTTLHLGGDRALDGNELAARLRASGVTVAQEAVPVVDALQHVLQDMDPGVSCLFLGSHIVVAEALEWRDRVVSPAGAMSGIACGKTSGIMFGNASGDKTAGKRQAC